MGRGAGDTDNVVARRREPIGRISPTHKGFVKLREQLQADGWSGPYRFDRYNRTEMKIFNSTSGTHIGLGEKPMPGFLRTRRNVSLVLRHEDDHITVMEEIIHPSGFLTRRHECGADIDKAVETFGNSIDELRELEVGSMPDVQYDLPREWLAAVIAERFRRSAKYQVKEEIRERQRQVELDAQVDIDELAAKLAAESGFTQDALAGQPA